MSKKNAFRIFAALSLFVLVCGMVLNTSAPAKAAAIKIMPLGDSITGSPGCWRALLWTRLQAAGYTNFDFVGTLDNSGDCGIPYDGNNEGHGGYLATGIDSQNQLPAWLSATNPDVVMMQLGTNDVWSNIAPATILASFSNLVDDMRANNPNVKILVAQITPLNPSGCADCPQRVINFNAAIPAWAASKSTTQSPITVVDVWTGFDTATDTSDGCHPNGTTGIQKVSDSWYPAMVTLLSGAPSATVTRTRTTGPTATRTFTPVTQVVNTATRTSTAGPTATRTRTPTTGPTATRTNTPSTVVAATATKTSTPVTPVGATATKTQTPITPTTPPTGSTCSPVTSTITAPFTYDGAGTFCWQSSNLGTYINSWNTTSVSVNGTTYTNVYVAAGSLPAKVNGYWYVSYNSTVAWGHFEAK
jgi:hypothetical protein